MSGCVAELAYRAYGDRVDWVNYAGHPMPSWGDLPPVQRDGWHAAVAAVAAVAAALR